MVRLVRNPFVCEVDDDLEEIQEEFLELIYDSTARDEFSVQKLEFWLTSRSYPFLGKNANKILIPFSSTYLCE